ncbi:alpha-glucosidase C-terminal domain-containing protein [Actinomyces lilanjuaniae]|uniref:alpha-glucosidase C-terminal domain-containing protein n=1 Tax=Actinomyces lilanjuaniae TaxID=2321394 RepID=UPI001FA9DB3F|nr:alpha-glucosidase C-terminal domain-containing protein [Actinomyces lilanjuaniae]
MVLPYYRRLISLRKQYPVVSEGSYEPYALDHPDVLAYQRHHEGQHLLVLCSFRAYETTIEVPADFQDSRVLVSNYDDEPTWLASDGADVAVRLRPYQALALLVSCPVRSSLQTD